MWIPFLSLFLTLSQSLFAAPIHLVAIGDVGKANDSQRLVAQALLSYCQSNPCDYGLLLGDNLYDEGMSSPMDPKMDQVFKDIYSPLKFPFFVALGNHDYGLLSNNWARGAYQLEYAKRTPQFLLPYYWYYTEFDHFVLAVLDTTRMMWSKDLEAQKQMLLEAQAKAKGKYLIVMGHHPYLSNGKHGNAGFYEDVSFPSFVSGRDVKKFFDENVCGKAHLYLNGHEHNLQLIDGKQADCRTLLIVSGSGASTTQLYDRNEVFFEEEALGFVIVKVDKNNIDIQFRDAKNRALYQGRMASPAKIERIRRGR